MSLVLVKKGKIRVWMIVTKKSGVGQKSATSKNKFSGKHNFRFGGAYSDKLEMKFNTALLKPFSIFANLKIQTLFAYYGIEEAFSPGKPSRKPFIYFK